MQRFFQRNHDVGFDIGPALRCGLTSAESAESGTAATAPEERFEEIAEAGAAEFELHAATVASPLVKSAAGLLSFPLLPAGWRLKSAGPVPIRSELIVFLALFGVTQHLVCFVDLLEFFFGGLFVFRYIGMIFARQLAKRAADLVICGRLRHTERLVIISKLDWHLFSSLCLRPVRATF